VIELTRLETISKSADLISNPHRLAIIMFLYENEEVRWKEIAEHLKKLYGDVNPNTINFHLNKLILENVVEKRGDIYRLNEEYRKNDLLRYVMKLARG